MGKASIAKCLAHNVRSLRKKKKMTQSDLAKRANISLIFLQAIESERKWLSPNTIESLAEALEVRESKLFENCFEPREGYEHVPDDIFEALAVICRHKKWQWDSFRWIVQGFERERNHLRHK